MFIVLTRMVRLISNVGRATFFWELFKTLNILPVPNIYIYIYTYIYMMGIVYYIKLNKTKFS
jgi:hypothetical protein